MPSKIWALIVKKLDTFLRKSGKTLKKQHSVLGHTFLYFKFATEEFN